MIDCLATADAKKVIALWKERNSIFHAFLDASSERPHRIRAERGNRAPRKPDRSCMHSRAVLVASIILMKARIYARKEV